MKQLVKTLVTVGGIGFSPVAPGTAGSLVGLLLFGWLQEHMLGYGALLIGICVLGIWAATRYEREKQITDPQEVVLDEVAGMGVALFALPDAVNPLWFALAGFFLFRLFDIWKPFPGKEWQRLPGGYGIFLDDLAAGFYANLCLQAAALVLERMV